MMVVTYPSFASGEPWPLSAAAVQAVAASVRQRLLGSAVRPAPFAELCRRAKSFRVNGVPFEIAWDADHPVHDPAGEPVLGVCEYDPCESRTVMISLNGELLNQPELLCATAAHELGHALFDMPAAMRGRRSRVFSSEREIPTEAAKRSWSEWRADEFMGALLAPKALVARAFAREASAYGVRLRWREENGIPVPVMSAVCTIAADGIAAALAELFGVTESFMQVRVRKYGLIR